MTRSAAVTYRAHPSAPRGTCAYCGEAEEVRDHFYPKAAIAPPVVWVPDEIRRLCFTLPACAECNGLLSDYAAMTFEERRAHLRLRLRARYASVLRSPGWVPDDLSVLGPRLRQYVEARGRLRARVLGRLSYEPIQPIGPLRASPPTAAVAPVEVRDSARSTSAPLDHASAPETGGVVSGPWVHISEWVPRPGEVVLIDGSRVWAGTPTRSRVWAG